LLVYEALENSFISPYACGVSIGRSTTDTKVAPHHTTLGLALNRQRTSSNRAKWHKTEKHTGKNLIHFSLSFVACHLENRITRTWNTTSSINFGLSRWVLGWELKIFFVFCLSVLEMFDVINHWALLVCLFLLSTRTTFQSWRLLKRVQPGPSLANLSTLYSDKQRKANSRPAFQQRTEMPVPESCYILAPKWSFK
jgi:hypothetical protein